MKNDIRHFASHREYDDEKITVFILYNDIYKDTNKPFFNTFYNISLPLIIYSKHIVYSKDRK